MSRYLYISLLLLILTPRIEAQLAKPVRQAIAFGVDLSPFIVRLFDHDRTGVAFTGRYTLNEKWLVAGEAGFENVSFDKREFDYKSNGSYLRAGFDYNLFKVDEFENNDNLLVGLRYGFAWQEHTNSRFTIVDGYWGDYSSSAGTSQVNSHWIEIVAGLRSEVFKNLYMGWSIRLRQLILSDYPGVLAPYSMPGFGKYDNKTNLGFTYTIEYQIPTLKRKNIGL